MKTKPYFYYFDRRDEHYNIVGYAVGVVNAPSIGIAKQMIVKEETDVSGLHIIEAGKKDVSAFLPNNK